MSALGDPGGEGVRWGAWSVLGSAPAAELLARSGWDWVVLDGQHGLWDDRATTGALAVLPAAPPVLVRVPWDEHGLVGRALDAGAAGVVAPMVAGPEEAARVAAACRYAPAGTRSWGPTGPLRGRPAPAPPEADTAVTCVVMVETAEALASVGAIAATPGVDAVLVGPFDLSLSLGTTVEALLDDASPASPLARVVRACTQAGVVPAAFGGDPAHAARLAEHGFRAVVAVTDAGALGEGSRAALGELRGR